MARDEFTLDFTDSKAFDTTATRTGNIVCVEIKTEHSKVELVLDIADFVELTSNCESVIKRGDK